MLTEKSIKIFENASTKDYVSDPIQVSEKSHDFDALRVSSSNSSVSPLEDIDSAAIMEKMKEEQRLCVSQISHEIRNPVTLINSSLQLIERQHPEVKTFAFWHETMEDLSFLRTLLDELSSLNNGDLLHPEPQKLQDWLPDFLTCIQNSFSSAHLHLELQEHLPTVTWDYTKIRQVFSNLIRNSLEASPNDCEVLFKISFDDPFVEIKISDHGCGIPSSVLPTLFEPFHTTKSNGTGLGLAICKRIVDSHHGTIVVSSTTKKGTTFTIRIPQNPFCSRV